MYDTGLCYKKYIWNLMLNFNVDPNPNPKLPRNHTYHTFGLMNYSTLWKIALETIIIINVTFIFNPQCLKCV